MKKLPPSKRMSKAMRELLEQGTEGYVLKEFLRLGKQLLIQELLEEVKDFLGRGRSKVIPRFLTEKSALKLVYGVLIRASAMWRLLKMGENEKHQLGLIRESFGIAEKEEVHV